MNLLLKCINSTINQLNQKYIIDIDTFKIADESHLLPFLVFSYSDDTKKEIILEIKNKLNAYLLYDSMQKEELKMIKKIFNENKIPFAIIKGERLEKYYKESFLRYKCDQDILIEKKDLAKASKLLNSIGYKKGVYTNHDITYDKKPLHIELHYKLIPEAIFGKKYFKNPFRMMKRTGDSYEYEFIKKEDEYIYYLYHLLRHYETSGIGLRHFIDLYLFKKNNVLDMKYIEESYKYTSFVNDCYYLNDFIDNLFNDSLNHEKLIERLINNRSFGSTQELTRNELNNKSTLAWLIRRMFPNIPQMKNYYPFLRFKILYILLPLLYLHHIFYFSVIKFKYSINRIKLAKRIKEENK